MKTVYFDIENYEEEFLRTKHNNDCIFVNDALNDLEPVNPKYADAEIISVFTTSRVDANVL